MKRVSKFCNAKHLNYLVLCTIPREENGDLKPNALFIVHVDGVRICLWTAATEFIPGWCVSMESQGGMMLTGENPRTPDTNLFHCSFVYHESQMDWLGLNPDLRGESPTTNRLSHGTAKECNLNQNSRIAIKSLQMREKRLIYFY
jgi:hypothetical protein